VVERAKGEHSAQVQALFKRADVPCYCQYWQFDGDHRQWQDRCANHREKNVFGIAEQLSQESIVAFVARDKERVVGWARVARPAELSKLYSGRLYRGLPCFSEGRDEVRTLACFLVDPTLRRQGVARKLLKSVIELSRESGAKYLEALPRGATDVSDEEQWMGPLALFVEAGFQVVHDFSPYPVLRLELAAAANL